ncbi:MAG: 50S ribosomal protein L25 [Bacteroidales bacterium]|nr:50S ribosomal protein L25 [Bacteroidales bacterium]
MKHLELQGKKRITGKKADVKSVRREGRVPCIIYGAGVSELPFSVDEKELKNLTHTPYSHIVDLDIEGTGYQAILKAIQYHPVTDRAIHVDFLSIDPAKPVTIDVPIKITGNSIGVRQGGKLSVPTRKLKVCGLIENLPDELPVDITSLGLGHQINAGDLKFDGISIVSPKGTLVCAVRATRNSNAAATEAAE